MKINVLLLSLLLLMVAADQYRVQLSCSTYTATEILPSLLKWYPDLSIWPSIDDREINLAFTAAPGDLQWRSVGTIVQHLNTTGYVSLRRQGWSVVDAAFISNSYAYNSLLECWATNPFAFDATYRQIVHRPCADLIEKEIMSHTLRDMDTVIVGVCAHLSRSQ